MNFHAYVATILPDNFILMATRTRWQADFSYFLSEARFARIQTDSNVKDESI